MKKVALIVLIDTSACGKVAPLDSPEIITIDVPDSAVAEQDASVPDTGVSAIIDAGVIDSATDSGVDSSMDIDSSIDSSFDAGIDVYVPVVCSNMIGTYSVSHRVLFTDCAEVDAGSVVTVDDSGASDDAGHAAAFQVTLPTSLVFVNGYASGYPACAVTVTMSDNNCSGTSLIVCDDGVNTSSYAEKLYSNDVNSINVQVIRDIEFKDDVTQTTICHLTEIVELTNENN